ncbi:MAG: Zn-ribbon domain-containing OB-fold protein [Methanomassiliicoccaceae archaeon]|nr:Zn-ribbon domain-containing OB-fold protein [Methanomassiliicoccaceae archaeon]
MSVARHWRETPGRYNLIGVKCGNCGKVFFPKRTLCPECRRSSMGKMNAYKLKAEGTVFTYSIIHDAPAENNSIKPYAVAMILTDDDVLITGQLVDVELEKVEIGMPVRAVLRKMSEDGETGVINYGYKFAPKN